MLGWHTYSELGAHISLGTARHPRRLLILFIFYIVTAFDIVRTGVLGSQWVLSGLSKHEHFSKN